MQPLYHIYGRDFFTPAGIPIVDGRFVKSVGERALLPPRLISGALNFYMAGQLAGAAMFLPEREDVLERAARDEYLAAVESRRSVRDRLSDIAFMRRFVQAELRPLPTVSR